MGNKNYALDAARAARAAEDAAIYALDAARAAREAYEEAYRVARAAEEATKEARAANYAEAAEAADAEDDACWAAKIDEYKKIIGFCEPHVVIPTGSKKEKIFFLEDGNYLLCSSGTKTRDNKKYIKVKEGKETEF